MIDQNNNILTLIKKYVTTEFLTVATFLIYAWGFLYNYLYYHGFGINITKYLSLQETFVDTIIFITIIIVLSLILIPAGYYLLLGIFCIRKKNRFRRYILITQRKSTFYLKFLKYWTTLEYFIAMLFYILITLGFTIFEIDTNKYTKFIIPIIGISNAIKMFFLSSINKTRYLNILIYSFIVFLVLSSIYIIALKQVESTLISKSIKKEVISLSTGATYITNDSIIYIGETSSTIFLFNKPLNNTIIINKSNVVQTQLINQATIKIKKGATETATPKKK